MTQLPKSLEKEPLVDAIFEVRLNDAPQLADILPGFLLYDLGSETKILRLPAADIPQPLRKEDVNLRFSPLQRIDDSGYCILIGDQHITVSCKLPYPKWPRFRANILDVMSRISKFKFSGSIERYSVRYVNLIQATTLKEQISKIAIKTKLGDLKVSDELFSLKIHRRQGDLIHILSIVTGAEGKKFDGTEVFGVLVDVDSIKTVNIPNFQTLANSLEEGLEVLKQSNKEKFFGCLTSEAIQEMRPTYE